MIRINTVFILVLVVVITGCGDPVGSPCNIRGSGFTASHNCSNRCLFYQKIQCPDGSEITPEVCSGNQGCVPGGCPSGQACYHEDDPFEERSYCVPADICGELPESALRDWEQESYGIALEKRKKSNKPVNKLKPKAVTLPVHNE